MIQLFKKALNIQIITIAKVLQILAISQRKHNQKMNRFEEALQYFDLAIKHNPKNSVFCNNNGIFNSASILSQHLKQQKDLQIILDKLNRLEEALKYYDQAIQINPEDSHNYIEKGNTLCINKDIQILMYRFEEALEYYDCAIQKNPENSSFYNNKAITLFYLIINTIIKKMNRFQEAQEYYDLAIQKNPENSDYYYNKAIAIVFSKINRFEEALEYYDLAIHKNPKNSDYYKGKSMILFKQMLPLNVRQMNKFEETFENCFQTIYKNQEGSDQQNVQLIFKQQFQQSNYDSIIPIKDDVNQQ